MVGKTFAPGATVAQVTRLHGMAESYLYAWRKPFAVGCAIEAETSERPLLIPMMIEDGAPTVTPAAARAVVTLIDPRSCSQLR